MNTDEFWRHLFRQLSSGYLKVRSVCPVMNTVMLKLAVQAPSLTSTGKMAALTAHWYSSDDQENK